MNDVLFGYNGKIKRYKRTEKVALLFINTSILNVFLTLQPIN